MVTKTIKQIKNLKAYAQSTSPAVWTAAYIDGNWQYGWYSIADFEQNNGDFIHKITDKLEYSL